MEWIAWKALPKRFLIIFSNISEKYRFLSRYCHKNLSLILIFCLEHFQIAGFRGTLTKKMLIQRKKNRKKDQMHVRPI